MKVNKKRINIWWIIIIVAIIVIGVFTSIFWKSNSNIKNFIQNNIIDPIKEIIGLRDSSVESSDGLIDTSNASSITESQDSSSGGGGGGGSSGSSTTPADTTPPINSTIPEDFETFSSLEELFNAENPVGNKVNVHGIALQISGVSTADSFFFTDDERVMNDITYMLFNKIDYHITVYNSLNVEISQSIISLTGTIVDCTQTDDGIYCVNAESIE